MGWVKWLVSALFGASARKLALAAVKQAAEIYVNNDNRREWAVKKLMETGMKESQARLVVELAVSELKDHLQ